MKIDNRLQTAKLKIFYMLMLGGIFSFGAYYVFEVRASIFFPAAVVLLALIYLFFLLRKSDYFYLEYTGNKIIVKYYTAHPFLRKYKAFEIAKANVMINLKSMKDEELKKYYLQEIDELEKQVYGSYSRVKEMIEKNGWL